MTDRIDNNLNFLSAEEWRDFFAPFSHIVLVGNSEAADPGELQKLFPATALFVFFNKVYKVLDGEFDKASMLVSRSGTMGANIVYRREVKDVLRFFPTQNFLGVLNVRIAGPEKLSPESAFEHARVRHLDLTGQLGGRYPDGKIATSGFAVALWLRSLDLPANIVLAGFSAKRSAKWKVFDVHDWTFEQIYLRICARRNELAMLGPSDTDRVSMLSKALPEVAPIEILIETTNVVADRLDGANEQIDRLISITKLQRSLLAWFQRIRPKTRKQRYLSRQKNNSN